MDDGDFVERLGFPERWKVGRGVLNFPAGLDGISLIESVVIGPFMVPLSRTSSSKKDERRRPRRMNVVVQEG